MAPATPADPSASVPPDAPVITIDGVCTATAKPTMADAPKTDSDKPADGCKTVITKAEFEKLANGVAPNITPQLKRQLVSVLPGLIALADEAKKEGLDKTPRYEELEKFAKMQLLSQELRRNIQEKASKVPEEDIATYYKEHPENFEQYNLDRLFVPRTKQVDPEAEAKEQEEREKEAKDEKLTEKQQKAKEEQERAKHEEAEQSMTKLAESLRARAAAGEDFAKLQKEAFEAGGMKIDSPSVNLPTIRRTGLPPAHAAVFDLKPGEVSQVINDSGGHYIYKMNSKQELSLEQSSSEIHNVLQNQRSREMMEKVNTSFKVETNDAYFGGGAATMNPSRMPNPRMAPPPNAPQAQPQSPPAQAPAAKPN